MKRTANDQKLKSSLKKQIVSSVSTPIRFQLDAPPVSMAALLKAARMGMAWAITLVLSCTLAHASVCPAVGIKAARMTTPESVEGERMANSQPQPALTASSQK